MIVGIIKCLPEKWYNEVGGEKYLTKTFDVNIGKKDWYFQMSLASKPKLIHDILYCYIQINGYLRYRLNIADIRPGGTMVFNDRPVPQTWNAKYWLILTAPVVKPEKPIPFKGFQGFRYTGEIF